MKREILEYLTELADECIADECDYEPTDEHVTEFLSLVADEKSYQEDFATCLSDELVTDEIARAILTAPSTTREIVERAAEDWARKELVWRVNDVLQKKEQMYEPDYATEARTAR